MPPIIRPHQVELFAGGLPTDTVLVFNIVLALLSTAGRNDNHAIRSTAPIDGGSRYILQYLNTLYVTGVNGSQRIEVGRGTGDSRVSGCIVIVYQHAVYHIKWFILACDGVTSTYAQT